MLNTQTGSTFTHTWNKEDIYYIYINKPRHSQWIYTIWKVLSRFSLNCVIQLTTCQGSSWLDIDRTWYLKIEVHCATILNPTLIQVSSWKFTSIFSHCTVLYFTYYVAMVMKNKIFFKYSETPVRLIGFSQSLGLPYTRVFPSRVQS